MEKLQNNLYIIQLKALRGDESDNSSDTTGAHVLCYMPAQSPEEATQKVIEAVKDNHIITGEIQNTIQEADIAAWDDYVRQTWPDFKHIFPTQKELPAILEKGKPFFSPFIGWYQ